MAQYKGYKLENREFILQYRKYRVPVSIKYNLENIEYNRVFNIK